MEISERLWGMVRKMKPYLATVFLQISFAVMYTIVAVSLKHGLSHFVFSVYRHAVATLFIVPFALILERKTRPTMTLPIFLRILLLGFIEPVMDQNLYYLGMKYTSATFASASVNILPAVTFIFAVVFRLESVKVREKHSVAKVAGTAISLGGAMVMSLYKGPAFNLLPGARGGSETTGRITTNESTDQHWVTGTILVLISCCGWSAFFILQSMTLKLYPAEFSLAALICFVGMVGGGIVTLVAERNMKIWVIGWDSKLLAVVYSGIVCSGTAYYVQGVVMKERGPVFVTSFSPLCMIVTAALGSFFLAEKIHLGSVIGAVIVVVGLYTVIWGKTRDFETSKESNNELPITGSTFRSASDDSNAGEVSGKPVEAPAKPPVP
ncbi:WAT1-related protein At4g08300-like [Momordica charantia]|uniref:WAT1-related protein n=1 Tax=Momordica charantia TaxID=3673 RepID=A0A6J1CIL0_MOMCH|nr:WAT1-related protein At4g08300-like [Momordica charantia]